MINGRGNRARLLKRLAYSSGALSALHRLRNRRTLTVAMFHRVLPESDPRWSYCDPEYTISATIFARCLEFFRAHYHVIGTADLLHGTGPLPDRSLLITFDDGWSCHEEYALPALERAGLPALAFIAGDAIDTEIPTAFWEMRLVHAFRRGSLGPGTCRSLWLEATDRPPPAFDRFADCLALVTLMEALPLPDLRRILARLDGRLGELPDDRHTITTPQLQRLMRGGVELGGHGASHHPLTRVDDVAREMTTSRDRLGRAVGTAPLTMSYPHGAYDRGTSDAAFAAGFRYLFTSDPVINALDADGPVSNVLGRVGIYHSVVTDPDGEFLPERLALWLFRRQAAALSGDGSRGSR